MRSLIILIFTVLTSYSVAETIGPLTYQLPAAATFWNVQIYEPITGKTVIYSPNTTKADGRAEDFSVNFKKNIVDLSDVELLEKQLRILFPSMELKFNLFENDANGMLYEWIAKDHGEDKIYGITRVIVFPEGTVTMMYTSYDTVSVERARALWLPVFQSAR